SRSRPHPLPHPHPPPPPHPHPHPHPHPLATPARAPARAPAPAPAPARRARARSRCPRPARAPAHAHAPAPPLCSSPLPGGHLVSRPFSSGAQSRLGRAGRDGRATSRAVRGGRTQADREKPGAAPPATGDPVPHPTVPAPAPCPPTAEQVGIDAHARSGGRPPLTRTRTHS